MPASGKINCKGCRKEIYPNRTELCLQCRQKPCQTCGRAMEPRIGRLTRCAVCHERHVKAQDAALRRIG